jgi:hypothetical protein
LLVIVTGCNGILGVHDFATPDAASAVDAGECNVDDDCADPHAVCIVDGSPHTCTCAAGYSPDSINQCTWTGVIVNPSFTTQDAWQLHGPLTIDPSAMVVAADVGAAGALLNCQANAFIDQIFTMPRRHRAEPLVLQSTYLAMGVGPNIAKEDAVALSHNIGPVWIEGLPRSVRSSFVTARNCLGESAYADPASTGRGTPQYVSAVVNYPGLCVQQVQLDIPSFDIFPANPGECGDPGVVPNGDAEGNTGWSFSVPPAGGVAGYVEGVGNNGSRGVRLFTQHGCDLVSASVSVSVPADPTASPVLAMYHTSQGHPAEVSIDGWPVLLASSDGVERFCLPAYMRGGAHTLTANVDDVGNGTCTDIVNDNLVLDDVALETDSSCQTDAALTNPGFESTLSVVGTTASPPASTAGVVGDSGAHGGSRDLQLKASVTCSDASVVIPAATPAASTAGGPALTFWYRYPGSATSLIIGGSTTPLTPTRDGSWHPGKLCLDPRFAGRPANVVIGITGPYGASCAAGPFETLSLDDFAVTNDSMCPGP